MSATIGTPPPTQALNLNNGVLSASAPLLNLSQTWNNAGATFTALLLNITDTASGSGSLLAELQVGGVSKFSVRKDGKTTAYELSSESNVNAAGFIWSKHTTQGFYIGPTQDAAINRVGAGRLKAINGSTGAHGVLEVAAISDANGNTVVAAQQAAIADAASADATDLPTSLALLNEVKAQLNTALSTLRAHGLIAS